MSQAHSHYAWSIDGPTCFHPITNELHRKSALKHLCTRARGTGLFLSLYLLFLLSSFSPSDSLTQGCIQYSRFSSFSLTIYWTSERNFFITSIKKLRSALFLTYFFLSFNTIHFFSFISKIYKSQIYFEYFENKIT